MLVVANHSTVLSMSDITDMEVITDDASYSQSFLTYSATTNYSTNNFNSKQVKPFKNC